MIATWIFGLALVFTPGIVSWGEVWPWTKAGAVLAMTWFHHWLGYRRKDFVAGTNTRNWPDLPDDERGSDGSSGADRFLGRPEF